MLNQNAAATAHPFRRRPGTATRARRDDPNGSQAAADRIEGSGRLAQELRATLKAVERWPRCTTRQLSERTGLSVHTLGRRLPELKEGGWIERAKDDVGRHELRNRTTTKGEALARTWSEEVIRLCVEATPREAAAMEAIRRAHAELDAANVPRADSKGGRLGLRWRIQLLAQRRES